MARPSARERFESKTNKSASCWTWAAARHPDGYGKFYLDGKVEYAHRVAFTWRNGAIAEDMVIDHTCHNRACVNTDHLRMVTGKQNQENRAGSAVTSKSGVRGVSWNKKRRKWCAFVRHNNATVYFGSFDTVAEAAEVVSAKRNQLFTHNDLDRVAA